MEIKNSLWVERFRPKSLGELVLDKATKDKFAEMIEQGDAPNLLFYGPPGTGKTTVARILMENINCETMELNSSLARGIDTVRQRVVNFVVIRGNAKWRIILMEEADGLTSEAQESMRNLMETYSNRARFIFTANYPTKIIDPIRSRCQQVEFKEMPRKECMKKLEAILDAEKVKYDKETVMRLVDLFFPDMRSMINTMQLSTTGKVLKEIREDVHEGLTVLELVKAKKLNDIRAIAYRLDHIACMRYLFDHIADIDGNADNQTEKRIKIAEYSYRDYSMADKELNFVACCLELMQ
jgi:DNA polymerase III delta prime subunit